MHIELNKVAGAALGTLLFTMVLGIASDVIYSPKALSKAGYDLPAAVEEPTGGEAASAAPSVPLPILLAKADAKKGEANAKACTACHSFDKGGVAKVGPPLYGVVGRMKASIAGFGYSEAMKAKGGEWSFEELAKFVANPKGYVNGTKMAYAGERDPAKEADILAYLRSLSDNPLPMPQADASAAQQKPDAGDAKK